MKHNQLEFGPTIQNLSETFDLLSHVCLLWKKTKWVAHFNISLHYLQLLSSSSLVWECISQGLKTAQVVDDIIGVNFLQLSPCVCLNFLRLWLGLELGFPINWGPLFWLPHMVILSHGIDLPCIGHCLQLEFMLTSLMHILHDMLTRLHVHLGDVDHNTIWGYNMGRWMNNTLCKFCLLWKPSVVAYSDLLCLHISETVQPCISSHLKLLW